ncbi:MAG TPA: Holliday junction resolvase RuvX [Candidatus Saccharimonadales bacterium]|nr:Holliday junction resolvase RuvX [Candidatus Saccharimonadales bacterium]
MIGLDVGGKRVGVAVASLAARLPRPLTTLERGDRFFNQLRELLQSEAADTLVVGLPRGMEGQHTAQTAEIEAFVRDLQAELTVPIHLQDEALTSKQAETELEARGRPYQRGDIDALAATYILQDWLAEHADTHSRREVT